MTVAATIVGIPGQSIEDPRTLAEVVADRSECEQAVVIQRITDYASQVAAGQPIQFAGRD